MPLNSPSLQKSVATFLLMWESQCRDFKFLFSHRVVSFRRITFSNRVSLNGKKIICSLNKLKYHLRTACLSLPHICGMIGKLKWDVKESAGRWVQVLLLLWWLNLKTKLTDPPNHLQLWLNLYFTSGIRGSDEGNLRAGPERWHPDPGWLGRREKRICSQHGPFLWGGHKRKSAVFLLMNAAPELEGGINILFLGLTHFTLTCMAL